MQTADEQLKLRERSKQAVSLALESKWEEAAAVNREILADSPDSIEALNRLGKALSELGRYADARQAFQHVIKLQPANTIAKKNLDRIKALQDAAPHGSRQGAPLHFFIEETGKTGTTSLIDLAPKGSIAKLLAGAAVTLDPKEHKLLVRNGSGEYVGTVEPKLGLRLLRLLRGGNRYEAAIAGVSEQGVRVIVREMYQHPSQAGRLSFAPKGQDAFRPYVWEGARSALDKDGESTADEAEEWLGERASDLDDVPEYKQIRGRSGRRQEVEEEEEF